MDQSLYPQPGRGRMAVMVVAWFVVVVLGILLVWYGFVWLDRDKQPEETPPAATSSPTPAQVVVQPTFTPWPSPTPIPMLPTATPLPVATPIPTEVPATPTTAVPFIVAGDNGVNVRSGPGTNYTRIGYLEPGTRADLIGRYSDWWQIRYNDAPAWVFGDIVTASNADNVPQVEPPPAPPPPTAVPATVAPTSPPPTVAPTNYRGLDPRDFQVEGAPGPYGKSSDIWFNMWVNNTGGKIDYDALGVLVEETGDFQKSYTYSHFDPGQKFYHRDHINQFSLGSGTYHLWMTICFDDGQCFKMMGPVEVVVQ